MVFALLLCTSAHAQQKFITVASTTSTEQSGLFRHLLPIFERKTGIQVRVVALGTGQSLDMGKRVVDAHDLDLPFSVNLFRYYAEAIDKVNDEVAPTPPGTTQSLDMGKRGDADVVFVHAKPLEEKFVAEGYGVRRLEVMYNDFVLVGPRSDPAKVRGSKDIVAALRKIRAAQVPFTSRGDKSGTHFAELELWKAAGVDIAKDRGPWYRDTGSGMGPTLNTAAGMNAYALTDRGTWLSFKNRGDLAISVEGDQRLFNQYGVILVNPAKHPHVKKEMAQAFVDWIVSPEGQKAIAAYKISGEQLFFPNAKR